MKTWLNIVSVSSFEQIPGAIISRSKNGPTSRDIRYSTRLSSELSLFPTINLLRGHGPALSQS